MSYVIDDVSRALARQIPRRTALKVLFGAVSGAVGSMFAVKQASATTKCGSGQFACGGICCANGEVCCNVAPYKAFCAPAGHTCCGNTCCSSGETCCRSCSSPFCAAKGNTCCGKTSCPPGHKCCNNTTCCTPTQVCKNGRCQASNCS